MPAAVAKGIIISLSIITALGLAVYENPQVQAWFEEQRQRLLELLRSLGEDLDPQTRREAEALGFEGRSPANDAGLRREASAARDAAAVATGRSLSNASTIRRIPVQGPVDADEAEERRRKGREYLARRNQQMYELRQRKKATKAAGAPTPPSPTSFDTMVDEEGKLKTPTEGAFTSPPVMQPMPQAVRDEMREIERTLVQPLVAASGAPEASSSRAFDFGSHMANPFGDEFAMDRSDTPKPPVPPKVALQDQESTAAATPPRLLSPRPVSSRTDSPPPPRIRSRTPINTEGLSYEEQLAVALSLSDQDTIHSATVRRRSSQDEESDLRAAIEASLREMDTQQAAHAVAHAESVTSTHFGVMDTSATRDAASSHNENIASQPLVDLTPDPPASIPDQPTLNPWAALWSFPANLDPAITLDPPTSIPDNADDELYRVTPELTHARLARLHQQTQSTSPIAYDPVREAAGRQAQQVPLEASFYSAASSVSAPSTHTLERVQPDLIDVHEHVSNGRSQSPTLGFQTDSDSDTFASVSAPHSRAESHAPSHMSDVEVIDVEGDSDDGVMSDDGIVTPDSWTEVGSRDGDSEMSDVEHHSSQVRL